MTDSRAHGNRSSGVSTPRVGAHPQANAKLETAANASRLSGLGRLLLGLLYLLPKNGLSRFAGRVASLRLPGPIQRLEILLFARLAGVDLSEARDPIESHDCLQSFFARSLLDDARKIDGDDQSLVAPCDGAWGEAGRVEVGTLVQVKGRRYSLAELLGDSDRAGDYEGGFFATFYLSPRDYHRFHTPAAGCIRRIDYHPGSLWPVNAIGLKGIDRLFARNERICAYLDTGEGDGIPLVLVPVGAMMVGSIRLNFDDLTTNDGGQRPECKELGDRAPRLARGEEWGHFEFGSTIVLLTPPGLYHIEPRPVGEPVRLGQIIGRRPDA
ncbi:MAG: archaetidylserine decarboxylase [Myxococcales bacterium]|nr:phosphatidylserine decarboxylase [Myxococcales bacterium]HIK84799.1 phosphatidylserine decarboxylase [Myxococcales bacterium]